MYDSYLTLSSAWCEHFLYISQVHTFIIKFEKLPLCYTEEASHFSIELAYFSERI